ncbi:hypothetical protein Acsp03_69120 [Actinomadura sp. NBRC 104412]|uniref:DUF397 domain-containing protein n=1 Tax=Actinomadura sp. NBRC 104412 TaxID=3032203 RepID=UPI0024A4CB42|nr:DUF397 domain-containing protein [Actinomadura sp. NBRC 104412]GLZ09446.1 hypothetical protein Acsp03_69120 [Actinomadura sp. NBRC 104412]
MTSRERHVGWRKSSYSGTGNNCVEAGRVARRRVGVRDTASGDDGPVLEFGVGAWAAFLAEVREGRHRLL